MFPMTGMHPAPDFGPEMALGVAPHQHSDMLDRHADVALVPEQALVGGARRPQERQHGFRRHNGAALIGDNEQGCHDAACRGRAPAALECAAQKAVLATLAAG